MNLSHCAVLFCLLAAPLSTLRAQEEVSAPKIIVCDRDGGCTHVIVDGLNFRTITTNDIEITATMQFHEKLARLRVSITNKSAKPFDVIPEKFTYDEVEPKNKHLAYVPYQKIVKSDANRTAWANFFTGFGAALATNQVKSQSTTNGTVQVSGSNGTSGSGTYEATSTTTTSVPDYAARERAQQDIEHRDAAISEEARSMSEASLKANTLFPGQTISGRVYFEFDKKAQVLKLCLPINGVIYQFASHVHHP